MIRTRRSGIACSLALMATWTATADEARFTLARAVPADAFLYVGQVNNPERDFVRVHWSRVQDALIASGVFGDAFELVGSLLTDDDRAELDRIAAKFRELAGAVDWKAFDRGEFAIVERMSLMKAGNRDVAAAFAEFVMLARIEEPRANYEGLARLLAEACAEINALTDAEALKPEQYEHAGAEVTSVDLLARAPGAPHLYLSVAVRDDVVALSFGQDYLHRTLDLLSGSGDVPAMADTPRFRKAFEQLPPAEDVMVFFDVQNMMRPFERMLETLEREVAQPGDVYLNTMLNAKSNRLNGEALLRYRQGDYAGALEIVQKAHEISPRDAILLYNLACFNALLGKREAALDWLDKAVDGGFYAPRKIASDTDLRSLRDEERYRAALARARELAREHRARDIVVNSSRTSEAYKLTLQAQRAGEQGDYERALEIARQSQTLAPDDPRVLYSLACYHARLQHDEQALEHLEQAIASGYYCPNHIASDPDLDGLRGKPGYGAALQLARSKAAQEGGDNPDAEAQAFLGIARGILAPMGILDYVATVEHTDGLATHSNTRVALVADAAERPFYDVLCTGNSIGDFDRFLPVETESFSVSGSPDLEKLYGFLRKTVRDAGPVGENLLARWDAWQTEVGFDVEEQLLSWIGEEFVTVTLDDGSSVSLVAVRDESRAREALGAAIEGLTERLGELTAKLPTLAFLSMSQAPPVDERLQDFHSLTLAIAPTDPIVCGVRNGYLIVGTSEQSVIRCLLTAAGEHPNILENERVMGEMIRPEGEFVALSLTDHRKVGQQVAEALEIIGPMSGMMGMAIPEPKARAFVSRLGALLAKLGPPMRLIDFYKSTAAITTFDSSGWHVRTVTHYTAPDEP